MWCLIVNLQRLHIHNLRRFIGGGSAVEVPAPDPLADAVCDPTFAGCTDADFAANDYRGQAGPISINMVGLQPYDPKCVTVEVGQTVQIGATSGHPFFKECAEDSIMDSQNGNTSQ